MIRNWTAARIRLGTVAGFALTAPLATAQISERAAQQQSATTAIVDSLYQFGRVRLARGDYTAATRALREITTRFPSLPRAGDALYWAAVALRGTGSERALLEALAAVDQHRRLYPRAASRNDAALLELQLCGEADLPSGSAVGRRCAALFDAAVAGPCSSPQQAQARAAAMAALVRAGDLRSAALVRSFMSAASGCPGALRQKVLLLATELPAGAGDPILIVASRDTATLVQRRALRLLAQIPSAAAVSRLTEAAAHADQRVARDAVDALAQNEAPGARAALRQMIAGRQSSNIQLPAIEALAGNLRGAEDFGFLTQEFRRMNEGAQRQALRSLGQRQDETVRAWLLAVASDSTVRMPARVQAIRALSEDELGLTVLLRYYDSLRARPLRAELLRAFASEGGARGLEKLRQVARNDADPALRVLAARLLRHEGGEDSQ